jgi:hypothetical protein
MDCEQITRLHAAWDPLDTSHLELAGQLTSSEYVTSHKLKPLLDCAEQAPVFHIEAISLKGEGGNSNGLKPSASGAQLWRVQVAP